MPAQLLTGNFYGPAQRARLLCFAEILSISYIGHLVLNRGFACRRETADEWSPESRCGGPQRESPR